MATICATPYDYDASWFYFSSAEEYERKYKAQLPVEEYEFDLTNGTEFEYLLAENFFKESCDIAKFFELAEEYENSITEENLVALKYLFEYENCDVNEALRKMDDVMVFEGTAEDYAIEICEHEVEEKLGRLASYFDYKSLARDFILNGDVYEFKGKEKDYIITS